MASCIYILNDYRDIADDRNHPVKQHRPLASGRVKKPIGLIVAGLLFIISVILGILLDHSLQFLFVVGLYFTLNVAYSLGFKNIAILDILILAAGFVLRVKAGAIIAKVDTSEWLIIMTYLLALFMSIAKRRDDFLLKIETGTNMRKSISGYNLDFLNTMLALFSAIIIVSYIMYTVSGQTYLRLGTHRLYYTSVFVIAGILRYLQITFVIKRSGSPTEILYKDRFIQCTLLLWVISIYGILYLRGKTFFA
jgi:4-hydroxybenzoate polyprenyltransferase